MHHTKIVLAEYSDHLSSINAEAEKKYAEKVEEQEEQVEEGKYAEHIRKKNEA